MARFKPGQIVGYRVLNWPCTDKDFTPVEFLATCTRHQKGKCEALALSFFRSPDEARAMFLNILDRGGDAKLRMGGNHIATVEITEADGMMSAPAKNGHFSLHESAEATLHESCDYHGTVLEDASDGKTLAS